MSDVARPLNPVSPFSPEKGPIQITPTGAIVASDLTKSEWEGLLNQTKLAYSAYHCILADVITAGQKAFGNDHVADSLEQLEFDQAHCFKAFEIGQLEFNFRAKYELTSEHYFILSREIDNDHEREKWAKKAIDNNLTALELRRSIEQGKIVNKDKLNKQSGSNSGFATFDGVLFQFERWEKQIGGRDKIVALPVDQLRLVVEKATPLLELIAAIEQKLNPQE